MSGPEHPGERCDGGAIWPLPGGLFHLSPVTAASERTPRSATTRAPVVALRARHDVGAVLKSTRVKLVPSRFLTES